MVINGNEVTWDGITREQLKYLLVDEGYTNSSIAGLFSISVSKVIYKRKKFNLSANRVFYERFAAENRDIVESQNEKAKEWLFNPNNIDYISKAITQYIFRNGPIESVHIKCKDFTDNDMRDINIFMVNHIAGLLSYVLDGHWLQIRLIVAYFIKLCPNWQTAEPEKGKIDEMFFMKLLENIHNISAKDLMGVTV